MLAARPRRERGMVTVEFALAALMAVILSISMAMLIGVAVVIARCHETAAEVARQEARGDESAVERAMAQGPAGAAVSVRRDGAEVVVTVTMTTRPWGPVLPSIPLSARAVAIREPG